MPALTAYLGEKVVSENEYRSAMATEGFYWLQVNIFGNARSDRFVVNRRRAIWCEAGMGVQGQGGLLSIVPVDRRMHQASQAARQCRHGGVRVSATALSSLSLELGPTRQQGLNLIGQLEPSIWGLGTYQGPSTAGLLDRAWQRGPVEIFRARDGAREFLFFPSFLPFLFFPWDLFFLSSHARSSAACTRASR